MLKSSWYFLACSDLWTSSSCLEARSSNTTQLLISTFQNTQIWTWEILSSCQSHRTYATQSIDFFPPRDSKVSRSRYIAAVKQQNYTSCLMWIEEGAPKHSSSLTTKKRPSPIGGVPLRHVYLYFLSEGTTEKYQQPSFFYCEMPFSFCLMIFF